MSLAEAPAGGRRRSPSVPFSATVAREICLRTMAGETQGAICADAHMPCPATLWRWARKHPKFARIYARAKALGERDGNGPTRGYCPVKAHEIAARVAEGESLTAIARDPAMPSLSSIFRWRHYEPAFADALHIAKAAMAERFSDLGWTLAMEATPETAYLTQVRLKQLRWTCAIMSPGTHGKLKALDAPRPEEVTNFTLTTFQTEVNPETGQVRGVALYFDPETGVVERRPSGEWEEPLYPLVRRVDYLEAVAVRRERGLNLDSHHTWDTRLSARNDPQG
ncbi:MAG: hypothetical protein ACJ798_01190 [Phenylobacterium sp.]